MNGVRKGFVAFLSLFLLGILIGTASSASFHKTFGDPKQVEAWLAESTIYEHIIPNALSEAQTSGEDTTVSLKDPNVTGAATQVFTPEFVQQNVNSFIDSNYAWLSGKTETPDFKINLAKAKQDFADKVGKTVEDRLAGLSVCTPEQLAQLQIPTDPLTVPCRPPNLDPKAEGARVTQELMTDGFLNKPVLTADTLKPEGSNDQADPYYKNLSTLPTLYQLGTKLPLLLSLLAILCAAGIIFLSSTRRRGIQRVGIILAIAGLALVIFKFMADALFNKFQTSVLKETFSNQLQQPYEAVLHQIESSLVRTDFIFGIAFLILAAACAVFLFATRERAAKQPKSAGRQRPNTMPDDSNQAPAPSPVQPLPRQQPTAPRQPSMDIAGPPRPPVKAATPSSKPIATPSAVPQMKKRPKPPRLIQ